MTGIENMRSGGQLLVEALHQFGAKRAFGVPGESYLAVLDAFYDYKGRFDFTICRHEGGAAFAAAAWGKLTGMPGVAFVTRGPGAMNAAIGVHSAYQDSSPMLLFIGQVGRQEKGRECFQELDYIQVFSSMAKWVIEINCPTRIPELVGRAWSYALSGRSGPVVVALPEDMLRQMVPAMTVRRPVISEAAPSIAAIAMLQTRLEHAKNPLFLLGGGGWSKQGRRDLSTFLHKQKLPALVEFRSLDLIDNTQPYFAGSLGINMPDYIRKSLEESDFIFALNVRFDTFMTDNYELFSLPNGPNFLAHSHASDDELNKIYRSDLPIHAGPNQMAAALCAMPLTREWQKNCEAFVEAGVKQKKQAPSKAGPVDMCAIMNYLQTALKSNAILTSGAGNFSYWPSIFFRYHGTQRLLAPQSGAMGYGLPAAISAKLAHPERDVICFTGDGDFQMTQSELGTALQAEIAPIILLLNNESYGTIRMHQEKSYPGRVSGTEIVNPDFKEISKAYGLSYELVEQDGQFEYAYIRAQEAHSGCLIEIKIPEI